MDRCRHRVLKQIIDTYLKIEKVEHYISRNETKVAHAERLIKQLKKNLFKYMDENNTFRWIDVLDPIVHTYNNVYHRSIKMTPTQARNADQYALWTNQYFDPPIKEKRKTTKRKNKQLYKFKVGDQVKVLADKRPFDREYSQRFTEETFTITDRIMKQSIPMYTIKDESNELITGKWFEAEMQKVIVPENKVYRIEKVLKTRKRKGKTEYFVKFRGYPKKFNAWVDNVQAI